MLNCITREIAPQRAREGIMPNNTLIAKLEQQIEQWEALALEARTRADKRRPRDLAPAYL